MVKTLGQLLDESYTDYKRRLPLFLKVSFLIYIIPVFLLSVAYIYLIYSRYPGLASGQSVDLTADTQAQTYRAVYDLFSLLFTMLLTFTLIKALALGRPGMHDVSVREAITGGLYHFIDGTILTMILSFIIIVIFSITLIPWVLSTYYWTIETYPPLVLIALTALTILILIPCIIYLIRCVFAFYALIMDNAGIFGSLSQSMKIVRGRWWKVFWYVLVQILIVFIASFVIALILSLIGVALVYATKNTLLMTSIGNIASPLVRILILPFSLCFMAEFYHSLKEGAHEKTGEIKKKK
jgi:hypothetical protein